MVALFVGLAMVALGAGGTWVVVFANNPAKARAGTHPRLIKRSATTAAPSDAAAVAAFRGSPAMAPSSPAGAVRISFTRRVAAAVLLLCVMLGIAITAGAVISAVIVLVVTVLS